ncbi:MAG: hypothetical protein EBT32_01965 [Betaproteobacteria bacterium]|nr:hypothetical protein [Betaproteobacteria bacterium]
MQITMRRQRKLLHRLVFLLLAIPLLGLASVQAESKASLWPSTLARQTEEPVKASLHADDAKAAAPTKAAVPARVWLGLRLEHQPGWHTYWINPGDSGLASRIEWTLPSGWTAPQAYWPMPKRIPVGPLMNFGYEGGPGCTRQFAGWDLSRQGSRALAHVQRCLHSGRGKPRR